MKSKKESIPAVLKTARGATVGRVIVRSKEARPQLVQTVKLTKADVLRVVEEVIECRRLRPVKTSGKDLIPVPTPGEILLQEFLEPVCVSQYRLAQVSGIPASRLNDIIKGRRGITADTAFRLSGALGMTPKFWLDIQADYDLRMADRENGDVYASIKPLNAMAESEKV